MNNRIHLFVLCALSYVTCVNAAQYQQSFQDAGGEHQIQITISNIAHHPQLQAKESLVDKTVWQYQDSLENCRLDPKLNFIDQAFEVKQSDDTVLFAYSIGCVGGIDPVTVKYVAYKNGKKYVLTGSETLLTPVGKITNKSTPIPDKNLQQDPQLYRYMLDNWSKASTVRWQEK